MDEATDEFAAYFTGQAPKVLLTTSKFPAKVPWAGQSAGPEWAALLGVRQ